jgi:hypothetical protein
VLAGYSYTRREESEFSEHTITSAEDSAMMVSAVVGASVDMGLFKAGELRHTRLRPLRLRQYSTVWQEPTADALRSGGWNCQLDTAVSSLQRVLSALEAAALWHTALQLAHMQHCCYQLKSANGTSSSAGCPLMLLSVNVTY